MKNLISIIIVFAMLTFFGCAAFVQPREPMENYRGRIIEWQQRAEREGWTISLIKDVVDGCIELSLYTMEDNGDHWQTFPEFIRNGMKGDCEDIAIFIMGTFKHLKYPHPVKVHVIRMLAGDHAVIKIRTKIGTWVKYNTVPVPLDFVDIALSYPIFEFDERCSEFF